MTAPPTHPELAKLDTYYQEASRIWRVNPEFIGTRQFYEIWEDACAPRPWRIESREIAIGGHVLELDATPPLVAHVFWDDSEMSPVLAVESADFDLLFLLGIAEGEPAIFELPPVVKDDEELSFGHRLELVYDVIAWMRTNHPESNVLELTLKDFRSAIEEISHHHDPQVVRLMKRLKFPFMKRLLEKAAEDMPEDELGPQLTLPLLDRSYAAEARAVTAPPEPAHTAAAAAERGSGMTIPGRTFAQTQFNLEFLADACRRMSEAESSFSISFAGAEVISWDEENLQHGIRVPLKTDLPVEDGERFRVYLADGAEPLGSFMISVTDQECIHGTLRWSDPQAAETGIDGKLFARPMKSPWLFISAAMNELRSHFQENRRLAGASNAILGLGDAVVGRLAGTPPPVHLDASQRRAWCCAVHGDNPVVLVQGPPGTGKTAVLEAVLRELCAQGKRILVTAPSNAAVDNICRRVADLPVLRFGNRAEAIATDVAECCWSGIGENVYRFVGKRDRLGGSVYAGTHVACLRDDTIRSDLEKHGIYDAIVFDEAGMSGMPEFLLCCQLAERAVLFGDHRQLPPFPLPEPVLAKLRETFTAIPRSLWSSISSSALEWLNEQRQFPILLLQHSYRCQNPRLMRFASTLFYNARVRPSPQAEYFRLPYGERAARFPASTLSFITTSALPRDVRAEAIVLAGNRPGVENPAEARIVCHALYNALERYPLREICIITPYRRQASLIQKSLDYDTACRRAGQAAIDEKEWNAFLANGISTVDSFQGAESDVVIISYVRSNPQNRIGFVDDPNRVNVGHTRCRREMTIVGDLECLKKGARNDLFKRLEHGLRRDGQIVDAACLAFVLADSAKTVPDGV